MDNGGFASGWPFEHLELHHHGQPPIGSKDHQQGQNVAGLLPQHSHRTVMFLVDSDAGDTLAVSPWERLWRNWFDMMAPVGQTLGAIS
jgi:hypothetical protein